MQGVENGHAAPSRGSSRPSHHEEAADGDEDDDDEIYEPPVKSYMYNLFPQKNLYNKLFEYIFNFQIAS